MSQSYRGLFDANIGKTFKTASKLLMQYPKSAASFLKIAAHEAKAKKRREQWNEQDVFVPPLLIVSTTDRCNLHCKQCYSQNACRERTNELPKERVDSLLGQVSEAGCSTVLLAGGEPLLSPDWVNALAEHNELLGLVFTNGTLFDEEWFRFFADHRSMLPIFSVEGTAERTDGRRGEGVSERIATAMAGLHAHKVPFGISVTTGAHNFDEVMTGSFAAPFFDQGCRLVVFVEYVPMGESTEFAPLSLEQKARLAAYCDEQTENSRAIHLVFPGNEDQYGGCLAAGRGFVHISSNGSLEPCPFAPYSDRNLANLSFIEALKSPLLKALRAEANLMHEGLGGCSLRSKEDWIKGMIEPM